MQKSAQRTLAGLAAQNAALQGARLIFDAREATYAELDANTRRVAAGLRALGVKHGDRVALWLDNRWPWLVTLFACARLGAIGVAINTKFRSAEVGDIILRSGTTHVLISMLAEGAISILGNCTSLGALRVVIDADSTDQRLPDKLGTLSLARFAELEEAAPLEHEAGVADDGIIIFTTSGTTSAPKFVLHDQRRVLQHAHDLAHAAALDDNSVMFLAPPFCGTFGFSTTFAALAAGSRLIIPAAWEPNNALRLMRMHRATHCMATDDAIHRLLTASGEATPLPSLRFVGLAGVNPRLDGIYEMARGRGMRLAGLYGSSELQAIASLQAIDGDIEQRAKRGGRMVSPNAKVRACDPATGATLDHGVPGELEFFVPDNGMIGYFDNPGATAAAYRADGYFRSGDLGFTETDRNFVFLARMGDTLRLGGFLVDPTEIELVLQSHPTIQEAQVVALETGRGNRPVAFVILKASAALQEDALKAFLGERLAIFKIPVRFFAMDDFPRTESANAAKVQKSRLKELARTLIAD